MAISLKYLETCKEMQVVLEQTRELLAAITQPVLTDKSLMRTMHESMQVILKGENKSYAIRVELLIFLYLYAPIKIVDATSRGCGIFNDISYAMDVNANSLSKYKATLLDYYKYNKPFRDLVNTTYEKLKKEVIL